MPLINKPVTCEAHHNTIIQRKKSSYGFNHSEWGCDELLEVRAHIRQHYRTEQRGVCAYCKNLISFQSASNAHVEHIAPKSLYLKFMFEPKNLCVVCADCNEIKRGQEVFKAPDTLKPLAQGVARQQYPRSSGAFLIVHPHFDNWDEHLMRFGHRYTDKSEKGAFTILTCKLNRYFHQNFGETEELVDDDVLERQMRAFIESKSSLDRARILESLREDMSRIN